MLDNNNGNYLIVVQSVEGLNLAPASLQMVKTSPPPNDCPRYDTKQTDDDVSVILEI